MDDLVGLNGEGEFSVKFAKGSKEFGVEDSDELKRDESKFGRPH